MKTNIPLTWRAIAFSALMEDLGGGDITSKHIEDKPSKARILAKESGILAGIGIAEFVFETTTRDIKWDRVLSDGERFVKNDIILSFEGGAKGILKGERVSLNFLQHLSGIASYADSLVDALDDPSIKILDTRKTLPNLRDMQKYAVKIGGCYNHRFGLYDMILIKENHIALAGGLKECLNLICREHPSQVPVEVEVQDIESFKIASDYPINRIMLDNMSIDNIKRCVEIRKNGIEIEVSGNITLDNIHSYRGCGVDFISCGSLTHSIRGIDLSLLIDN